MKTLSTVKKIEKIVGYIGVVGLVIAAAALVFNFAVIIADVIGRNFFQKPITGSSEYVALGEIVLIFFGMAYTQHKRGMVHITYFMRKLPGQGPVIAWMLVNWLSAIVGVLLAYAGFLHTDFVKMLGQSTGTLYIPYYPFYFMMSIGFVLMAIQLIFDACTYTIALFNKPVREKVISEWPM